jgi:hypothetical protein
MLQAQKGKPNYLCETFVVPIRRKTVVHSSKLSHHSSFEIQLMAKLRMELIRKM